VDLRELVPAEQWPVWDQGSHLPSCASHAVASVALFEMIRTNHTPLFQPSRLFLYWAARRVQANNKATAENPHPKDRSDEEKIADTLVSHNVQVLMNRGVCADAATPDVPKEWVWGYSESPTGKPLDPCWVFAQRHKAATYARVNEDLDDMKACLAAGHPFTVCIRVFPGLFEARTTGKIPLPSEADCRQGSSRGHAMVVVGYDDASRQFIVRNSRGTGWGDGGHATLPYEYVLDSRIADSFLMLTYAPEPPAA
jgi:C1A family cysteine protease